MRAALLLSALFATSARADVVVRPFLGVSGTLSDSGFGIGAQAGLRVSPVLARVTLDLGGNGGSRGFVLAAVRGGWLMPVGDGASLLLGAGVASLTYGFIFDNPAHSVGVLLPEAGILLGADRGFGRIVLGVTGVIPLGSTPNTADYAGQQIRPPHVLATLVLSL